MREDIGEMTSHRQWISAPGERAARSAPRRRHAGGARGGVILVALCICLICLAASALSAGQAAHASGASGRATPSSEVYFGLIYPQTPDIATLQKYNAEIGKPMSMVLWYQSWMQDGQRQDFPTAQLEAVREQGAIPVLAWQPENYPGTASEPQFSLSKIANGAWDEYIRAWATAAKAWGHPFFLRFAGEMNGNWTTWSEETNGNAAGQFVLAWRHVHDIFTQVGATNATWVWCPNVENAPTIPLPELYPGNAYVDWAGMDGYNFASSIQGTPWWSFARVFQVTYNHLLALVPASMPIMIGETGSVEQGGSKSQWITDALTVQLTTHFQRLKALVWFDTVDGAIDLRVDTSPQSLTAFRAAIASPAYQANKYGGLSQSPIPAPEQIIQPTPVPTATLVPTATPVVRAPSTSPASGSPVLVDVLLGLAVCAVLAGVFVGINVGMRRRKAALRQS